MTTNKYTHRILHTVLGKVEYCSYGSGKPVLFFHGGHSNCHEDLFTRGYDLNKYQLIIPSRPGYGQTSFKNLESPERTADLFYALYSALNLKKVIIVGISAGGTSAISFASKYPKATSKLVLISAVSKRWMTSKDANYKKGSKLFHPKMEALSWAGFRLGFKLVPNLMTKTLFEELSTKKAETNFTEDEISTIKEMSFKQRSGHGFILDLEHDINPDVLEKVKCKTLIMHSENDNAVAPEMAHHANQHIEKSALKTYDNKWGHLLWVGEEASLCINDLMEFI